jgi:peptide/nickel transport system permease protein
MIRFVARRVAMLVGVVFGAMTVTFVIARVIPQNVAQIWAGVQGFKVTPDAVALVTRQYHLNEPLIVQYGYYLRDLASGRWGTSPVTGRPVATDILMYLPNTMELAAAALLLAVAVSVPIGVVAARARNSWVDQASRALALIGVAAPTFWIGLLLQFVFYYWLGWVRDPGGMLSDSTLALSPVRHVTGFVVLDAALTGNGPGLLDAVNHLALPAISLALPLVALLSRMTRSSMLEVLNQDYVRTARAKGMPEWRVTWRHALRNALMPTVTVLGLSTGWLLTGSVVTELIFYWPGVGRYAVGAVTSFDFPAVTAYTALAALIFSLANLVTDVVYAYMDPRIRFA